MIDYTKEELKDLETFSKYLIGIVGDELEGYFQVQFDNSMEEALENLKNRYCIVPSYLDNFKREDFSDSDLNKMEYFFLKKVSNLFWIRDLQEETLKQKNIEYMKEYIRIKLLYEISNHNQSDFRDTAINGKFKINGDYVIGGFNRILEYIILVTIEEMMNYEDEKLS